MLITEEHENLAALREKATAFRDQHRKLKELHEKWKEAEMSDSKVSEKVATEFKEVQHPPTAMDYYSTCDSEAFVTMLDIIANYDRALTNLQSRMKLAAESFTVVGNKEVVTLLKFELDNIEYMLGKSNKLIESLNDGS